MSGKGITTKKKAPVMVPLFVYGTLKRGFPLHEWVEDQEFVSTANLGDHTLISLGAYPALVYVGDISNFSVEGELWMVEQKRFEQLRKMEERVGYATEDVELNLPGGLMNTAEAKAFVFMNLQQGKVKWEQQRLPKQVKGRVQMYPGKVVTVSNAPLI